MQPPEMRTNAPTFAYLFSNEWDAELPAWGYWKIPLMGDGGDIMAAHIGKQWKRKLATGEESDVLEIGI